MVSCVGMEVVGRVSVRWRCACIAHDAQGVGRPGQGQDVRGQRGGCWPKDKGGGA